MKVENPAALRFILEDDLYLLNADKVLYTENAVPATPVASQPTPLPQPEPAIKTPVIEFNYAGKNLKNFLVLVHYPDLEFIKDTHLTALENIIKRKDLSLDDIAILNLAKYINTNYNELTAYFKPAKLLVLGNEALPPGIAALKLNAPQVLSNITALYSFSFNEMMDNTDYKKAFWEQMKSL